MIRLQRGATSSHLPTSVEFRCPECDAINEFDEASVTTHLSRNGRAMPSVNEGAVEDDVECIGCDKAWAVRVSVEVSVNVREKELSPKNLGEYHPPGARAL